MPTITQITEGNTVLVYSLQTEPTPIQVSPTSGPPSIATLRFVLTAPLNFSSVLVKEIVFRLPIGDPSAPDSNDLTETATGISASVSSSGADKWSIGPGAGPGLFVLKPADAPPMPIAAQGLTVEFTGIQVSPIVGTAKVKIVESTDQAAPQPRQCSIAVPKFPLGFSVGNFSADAPMVSNGAPAILTWNGGTQATYTMLWSAQSRIVSDVRRWVSPPLTDTTTFILQVSVQQSGQTVVLHFSVTVIVSHPSVVAKDLTVLTTSQFHGAVTATGQSTLSALAVTGKAEVASLVSHALKAEGNSVFANLTIGGHASLWGSAQPIKAGVYDAYTDGFVCGSIGFIDGNTNYERIDANKLCWGWVRGSSTSGYAIAAGGTCEIGMRTTSDRKLGPSWSSFLLPVQGGTQFWVQVNVWDRSEVSPWASFVWVPSGGRDTSQPTINFVSELLPNSIELP